SGASPSRLLDDLPLSRRAQPRCTARWRTDSCSPPAPPLVNNLAQNPINSRKSRAAPTPPQATTAGCHSTRPPTRKCPPGVLSWAGSTRGLPTLARAFVQHPSGCVRIRSKLAGTGQEVQRIHGEVVWVPGGNDLPCACEFYTHEARLPQPLPRTKSSPSRSTRASLGLHLAPSCDTRPASGLRGTQSNRSGRRVFLGHGRVRVGTIR